MIGIIGAMDVEVDALKERTENKTVHRFGIGEYVTGTLEGTPVCIARCSIGKVNAALCTQLMIDKFAPDCIINVGVGCSLQKDIVIKDVVVATEVCEHDMDYSVLGAPKGYIDGINRVKMPTDEALSDALVQAATENGETVHRGCVASGDQFIASQAKKDELNRDFDAVCGEMEGAAIGHVCTANGVPFAVLRSISDGGDDDAQVDFPTFKIVAAKISTGIILRFLQAKNS